MAAEVWSLFIDKSILIRAPPEQVFAWLSPCRMARWDHSLLRASGHVPLAPGARIERVARALGFRLESAAEAIDVEPGRRFAWRQVAGDYAQHRGAFTLEPAEGGATRLRLLAEVELPFVLPRMVTESELRSALDRDFDDALFNLKDLAERAAPPPGAGAAA